MTMLPIPSYPWIVQQPVGLGTDKLKSTINIIIEIKEIISISIPQLEPRIKLEYKILEKIIKYFFELVDLLYFCVKLLIMRKTSLLIFFLFISIVSFSQTKKSEKPIIWTWNGKVVNEKTLRDSLKVFYFKYIDSVKSSKSKV